MMRPNASVEKVYLYLSNDQKRVIGEVFSEATVRQIVPEGKKLTRMQGAGETGIDDLFRVNRPDVDYVVIEYKFVGDPKKGGNSSLINTSDGKQASERHREGWESYGCSCSGRKGAALRR